MASGIKFALTKSYMGEENGISPRFAMISARPIVANGAESAFPTLVLRSNVNPKEDRSMTADRT